MDFKQKILYPFPGNFCPLPFYMTYPGYRGAGLESALMQDMEYLQQAYPREVKHYQRRVAQILDKMDYEGSMIYDEYPDYGTLRRMTESILKILQNEEDELPEDRRGSAERRDLLADLLQILLCDEVYKRRHGGRRRDAGWIN